MASLSPSRAAAPAATAMPTKAAGSSSARAPAASALTRRTPSSNRLVSLSSAPLSSAIASSSANQCVVASVPSALPRGPSFSGKGEDVIFVTFCCAD